MSRRGFPWLVLAVLCGLQGVACGQNVIRAALPPDDMLAPFGLTRAWWSYATLDPVRDRLQFFSADEQVTVAQSDSGMVTTIDNATGRRLWSVQVGASTEVRFAAATSEHHVCVVSGTLLYGFAKKTGELEWQVRIPSSPSTAPSTDDARIYVGSINGAVYAYGIKTLDDLAKKKELSKYAYRTLVWEYKTGGRVSFPPVSSGTIVAIPSSDGSLYGLTALDHRLRYQFESDRPIIAPIGLLGDRIFVATGNMKLYSLNADTGALRWERLTGLNIRKTPRVIDDQIFVFPEGGGIHCRSAKNGDELWSNPDATDFLAATPNLVYTTADVQNVMIFSRANGRQLGRFPMLGFNLDMANDRSDRIYLASDRGLIVCLRERDREFPLFHRAPEKKPIVPEIAPEGGAKPAAKKPKDDAAEPSEEKKESTEAAPSTDEAKPKPPAKSPAKRPAKKPAKPKPADSE